MNEIEKEIKKKINHNWWNATLGWVLIILFGLTFFINFNVLSLFVLIVGIILVIYGYSQKEHWERELLRLKSK